MCLRRPAVVGFLVLVVVVCTKSVQGWAEPERAPVPDAAAQKEASELVTEVYGERCQKAGTYAEKVALAQELLQAAVDPSCEPPARYVMLGAVKTIATEVGDVSLSLGAVDQLGRHFAVDVGEMKCAVVKELMKTARAPLQRTYLAAECFDLTRKAVQADDFASAKRLSDYGVSVSRAARHRGLVRYAAARQQEVEKAADAYSAVKSSIEFLKTHVGDAESNLAVGKYLCYVKGDWARGLPMLVLGSDAQLASVAETEIKGIPSHDAELAQADAWWDLAQQQEGSVQRLILRHAAEWYERALPWLAGLSRTRVEKRLEQIHQETAPGFLWLADLEPEHITVLGPRLVPASPEEAVVAIRASFTVNGVPAKHGLWAHPSYPGRPSRLVFDIHGAYGTLSGAATLADSANQSRTALTFEIQGDGQSLWKSKGLRTRNDSQLFAVDVSRVKKLELIIHCPGSNHNAHAVWFEPFLIR